MKIVFIGNFDVDFTTESHHKKTFEKLGHTVISIQENRSNPMDVITAVIDANMLYWTHTHGFKLGTDSEIKAMLRYCKDHNIPTVGYHMDLWLGLEREKDLHTDPYWNIEHFFTVDKLMADWLCSNTNIKGHFLPAGVYEDECYIAPPDYIKYPHEIVFTGNKNYHKEHKYRTTLIDWLHGAYGDKFAHYGGGGKPTLRGHELNVMYSSAKIVIGDTLCKDFNYPEYLSDRAFEICGRGGFMIFPYITGIENHYIIGEEIITYNFNYFEQLKFLIDLWLFHNEERETIRLAGHERVKKDHTYTQRLQSLLTTLNLK